MNQIEFINIEENTNAILSLKRGDFVTFQNVLFQVDIVDNTNKIFFDEVDGEGNRIIAPKKCEMFDPEYEWRHIREESSYVALATRQEFFDWITNNQAKAW